ncbi:MAG: DUF2132 domain-containing protein [Sulfurimonas sp.]|nr:DUF2132 domain-containing protein [Sulfurimonas sp.]MBU1216355.1 VF530 family protein [bacterium]MBU1434661.1 VF530 family protein [bacterium]MBU1502239.1 VF530 family protein [bacterium]MBU3938990.1 VF530 family protein [bacterium]
MSEAEKNKNNPLHGIKLQEILEELVRVYGYKELGKRVEVRCFLFQPSINSCLKFLRKTPWARAKIEEIYLASLKNK